MGRRAVMAVIISKLQNKIVTIARHGPHFTNGRAGGVVGGGQEKWGGGRRPCAMVSSAVTF